ncbi:hypothetical protein JOF53_003426 [Crossiella equi]|uniref:Lipoprotein n=1 Tax=Crossiella equi TaxID=130796 RepID=A0ABS5ADA9_9PSEU|nr:hypothetical protein [Crossiella equi]MBP2474554.1 hypothetical protein [Crossiella equi]
MSRKVLVAGSAALLLVLGACGGQAAAPQAPSGGATTSAAAATDTKFTSADQLNKAIFAAMKAKKTVSYRATGTVEGKPEQAINSTGALEYGADGVSATINNKSEGKDQIVTITPKGIYLKLGAETGDPAKPWVKITPGGEDIFSKLMGAVVSAVQTQADLSKQLENIKSGGTITSTGEDTVNGEKVTKYAVSVDVKKVAEAQTDPLAKKAMEALVKAGASTSEQVLYVKGDLLVRQVVTQTLPVGKLSFTNDYSGWGEPAEIIVPKDGEVAEAPKLPGLN